MIVKKTFGAAMVAAALSAMPLTASASVLLFNAGLTGAAEVPPNSSPATGVVTLFYDDNNSALTTDDRYSFALSAFGLSGQITGAHIHRAPAGVNGPVVVPLNAAPFTFFQSGSTVLIGGSNVAPPYASFLSDLQAGLAYTNIHTALYPGGEIRGQLLQVATASAPVYQFNAGLTGAAEVPPNPSTATGVMTLFYDDNKSALTTDDSYSFALAVFGLSGSITGAHIHAPAPVGVNGPVVVPLNAAPFTIFQSGGTVLIGGSNRAPPSASFLSQLQAGLAYTNIHTAIYPGGEIRGQLFQVADPVATVPEPSTYALMAAGLAAIGLLGRRRSKAQR